MRRVLGAVLVSAAFLAHGQAIRLESSSAAFPLSKAVAGDFARAGGAAAKVLVGESGTAEALRRLCAGEAELATVSRPILNAEIARCSEAGMAFVEMPVAFDAIVVVVNPRNSFLASLSVDELKTIWEEQSQAKLRRWKDLNAKYPDLPLKLYAPEAKGERGNYFNEAILGPGKESRRDVTVSADNDVLVQAVARDVNALGYVPLSYYAANLRRLKAVPIAAAAGARAVMPTQQSLANGEYQPLSRPLFLYVSAKGLAKPEVGAFAELYLQRSGRAARELNYAALTDRTYQLALERLRKRVAGSAWNGAVPVGLTVEALQRRLSAL